MRQYLGKTKKVNKKIIKTLETDPERFGLYNNGITIVVKDIQKKDGYYYLTEPYIVNGCQTTQSIWKVLENDIKKTATGADDLNRKERKKKLGRSLVIVKVVKVGGDEEGNDLLRNITEYTNSQNAVKNGDFVALDDHANGWAPKMKNDYGVFLEIQRGALDYQIAMHRLDTQKFDKRMAVNVINLLKIYASGWLGQPGEAFSSQNDTFAPGGKIFNKIVSDDKFDVDDLFAAFCLHRVEQDNKAANKKQRQCRALFYFILTELLRKILKSGKKHNADKDITNRIKKLFDVRNPESDGTKQLIKMATETYDAYFDLDVAQKCSIYHEQAYLVDRNLNTLLKHYDLEKPECAQCLHQLLEFKFDVYKAAGGYIPVILSELD